MTHLLVSDTSVLIDLERGSLLQTVFKLPTPLAVPDVMYENELSGTNGPILKTFGLRVLTLDERGVSAAQRYLARARALSVSDAFALALAKTGSHTLICGDRALAQLAKEENVECHGLFWILDQMLEARLASGTELRAALKIIASHPRCRLPKQLVDSYLTRFGKS